MKLLAELLERVAGGSRAPGLHARLLERAAQRLVCAAGVPRGQRAGARGDDRICTPAPGGRALRRGAAHEDSRAGGLGRVLPIGSPNGSDCPRGCARRRGACRARRRLVETERVLASVIEAVIGACYLNAATSGRRRRSSRHSAPRSSRRLEHPVDFKSALQELLARRGEEVAYRRDQRGGTSARAHLHGGGALGRTRAGSGRGRSKKHAEQEAAREAVEKLEG